MVIRSVWDFACKKRITGNRPIKTFIYTGFALIAFAANSVICRIALGEKSIDPASFTIARLASGAVVLVILLRMFESNRESDSRGSWISGAMLFSYAISFSLAYVSLSIGTGALILFGAVQLTMILKALVAGKRLDFAELIGVLLASAGLLYLVSPGLTAPPLIGAVLMAIAGISWGIYSLRGIGAKNPLAETTSNFVRSLAFVVGLFIVTFHGSQLSPRGILLSILSGAVASGMGYAVWYTALKALNATQAAVVQLIVPILAAMGGIIFLSEQVSIRLIASSMMILGGVGMAVLKKVPKV